MKLDRSLVDSTVDYSLFGKDYGIFGCSLKGFQGKSTGLVSVELRFKTAPKQPISVMLVPEYSSCCIIDGDGNVSQSDY